MATSQKRRYLPLTVVNTRRLTPNLVRLELEGDALADFPPGCGGGYVKLAFGADGRPLGGDEDADAATLRTYSIRSLDAPRRRLAVDFVLHGDGGVHDGPASAFARVARPGDAIAIAGPGGVKSLDPTADWYLIAGDMTALPAISAKLEERAALGTPIAGHLVVELLDEADAACLDVPDGLELHTVVVPDPAKDAGALLEAVRALPWRDGRPFAWCAAEFGRMRGFRDYVRGERGIGLEDRYVSSYWMLGRTEEGHKVEKRVDAARDAESAGG